MSKNINKPLNKCPGLLDHYIKEIAEAEELDQSHVTRMINKAFLAPDIIRAILNGTQPSHLTLKHLKQFRALPNDWNTQKSLLGFTQ